MPNKKEPKVNKKAEKKAIKRTELMGEIITINRRYMEEFKKLTDGERSRYKSWAQYKEKERMAEISILQGKVK